MVKTFIDLNQHGFFSKRSVVTNLVPFVQNITNTMESGRDTCAVYTDFSKAFDKVHHSTLLVKLGNFGVHGTLLRLFESYLTDRVQYVVVNGVRSTNVGVTSGVPQGSHLGPLLFSVFLNDIGQCFANSQYSLYADDLKISRAIDDINDYVLLQADLLNFASYCICNRLFVNIDKCHCILFSKRSLNLQLKADLYLNNVRLKSLSSVKDLGVTLDSKLLFDTHVEITVQKALKNLGYLLRVTKDFKNVKSLITLFNSLVRPILKHATTVCCVCIKNTFII